MLPPFIADEWSPLKEVILGVPCKLFYDFARPSGGPEEPWVTKLNERTTVKFKNELDRVEEVILSHGAHVLRPKPVEVLSGEPHGLVQMFARDLLMVIHETVIIWRPRYAPRAKEIRGIGHLIAGFKKRGVKVIEVPEEPGLYLEGGDVLVDLPYIYVGIGAHASTLKAVGWLQGQFPDFRVIPVRISSRKTAHLDCYLTLIGPKTAIAHLPSLTRGLPEELKGHDIIPVDTRLRNQLGSNVFMLDPETILVQARHIALQRELKLRGFKVVPLNINEHILQGGGFRCMVAPLQRSA